MNLIRKTFVLALMVLSLVSCVGTKNKIKYLCVEESIPIKVCSCMYDELSKNYSESEISDLYNELEKFDKGLTIVVSPKAQDFAMDMFDNMAVCLAPLIQ